MTRIPPKKLKLRAFRIENFGLTDPHSGILKLLQQALTSKPIVSQRRMLLNAEDPDRDLLANFIWATNNTYLFGMMLRIIPADNGGVLDEELFNRSTITMADISVGNSSQNQYKDHFYFALNNNYLVTSLSGNTNISHLQTYINWLLDDVRGERQFQLIELTKLPDGVSLNQIESIKLVAGNTNVTRNSTENSSISFSTTLNNLKDGIVEFLMGSDRTNFERILNNQLVEATLSLKLKRKPRDMAEDMYQRTMEAVATNVSNDNGIVISTKDGNKYTGESVKLKKAISVECIAPNRIVEEQLRQQMESFLREVKTQQDD